MRALLEREGDLATLASAAEDAAHAGVVALIYGEPGIGKTSLVRAFLSELPPGTRTLVGGCDDLITPRAFGPLRDAVRLQGGPLTESLTRGDRDAVFLAMVEELSHPHDLTALVIEDVHWADDATLDVLQFAIRRIETLRALIVLTYRDDGLARDHPLRSLLGSATGPSFRRLPLQRLSPAAVASLSAPVGRDPDAVFAATGGNPFFVTETLAARNTTDVPVTVVDAVLARMRILNDRSRRALEQLSVVPTPVEYRLAEALTGGLEALADAERHGMLLIDRERVSFRHELARLAVEQSLPSTRRVALNRVLINALVAVPDPDPSRLVHHAVQAGDVATIVAYAPRAGREAAQSGSHRQALAHFGAVVAHEEMLPERERARCWGEYAWELYNAHRFRDARNAAERSYALWRRIGDPVQTGTALVTLSRHRWMLTESDGAWSAIEEATRILDGTGDVAARASAHTYRAAILTLRGESATALPELRHARALAEEAGAPGLVSLCLNYEGAALVELGDARGLDLQRQSLATAWSAYKLDPGHPLRGENVARAYTNLASTLENLGYDEELAALLPEALSYVRDRGFRSHAYNLEARRCRLLIRRGQWKTAEAGLRELDRAIEEPGVLGRMMLPALARLLVREGKPDAEDAVERAWNNARATSVRLAPAYALLACLEWAWLTGRPERASARLDEVLAILEPKRDTLLLAEVLRYAKRAGLIDAEPFEGCPEPWASGLRGDWQAAAAGWHRVGNDYERALELAESGDVETTKQALALLDQLGAMAAATTVRDRLRSLGASRIPRGPQLATKANPAGLTDRQVEVLRLLGQGLTNAEIATRLVVSVRTVDHHVAAVLDKLQVQTRRAAAQRAAELGVG